MAQIRKGTPFPFRSSPTKATFGPIRASQVRPGAPLIGPPPKPGKAKKGTAAAPAPAQSKPKASTRPAVSKASAKSTFVAPGSRPSRATRTGDFLKNRVVGGGGVSELGARFSRQLPEPLLRLLAGGSPAEGIGQGGIGSLSDDDIAATVSRSIVRG